MILILALGAVALSAFLYVAYEIRKSLRYFEDRNIPHVKSKYLLGSDPLGVLARRHVGDSWDLIYKQLYKERVGGFFQTVTPILMVNDPELVNEVLTTAFDNFFDRNFYINEKKNPLDANIFFLRGNKWRYLRNKLSPLFTTGKLKWMQEEMDKCADYFIKCMDELADGKDRDIGEQLASYATDVIGSCAFGLEPECMKNRDSKLRQIGREMFDPRTPSHLFMLLQLSIPRLLPWINMKTTPTHIEDFFCSTVNQALSYRRKTGAQRKDLLQLLLQLQDKGVVEIDTNEINKQNDKYPTIEKIELTDMLLAAQSFLFYLAGFETTSRTMHYLLYYLARNQEAQEKARKEVLQVKNKYGKFSYDALKDMEYLEKCITETTRLRPAVTSLSRECTKDYTLSDGTFVEKGLIVGIPIYSIQRDPRYFPDPLKFNPERFDTPPLRGTYLPFGDGPRICIGMRFAILEIKIVVSRLLEKYIFENSSLNAEDHLIEMDPRINILCPKNGLWVKMNKIK